jgi:hypothetical protein
VANVSSHCSHACGVANESAAVALCAAGFQTYQRTRKLVLQCTGNVTPCRRSFKESIQIESSPSCDTDAGLRARKVIRNLSSVVVRDSTCNCLSVVTSAEHWQPSQHPSAVRCISLGRKSKLVMHALARYTGSLLADFMGACEGISLGQT